MDSFWQTPVRTAIFLMQHPWLPEAGVEATPKLQVFMPPIYWSLSSG